MEYNVVQAVANHNRISTTRPLRQYDNGITLQLTGVTLPAYYEAHFANQASGGTTITKIGNTDGVEIPDELLETGLPVYAWVYIHTGENDGETVYEVMIPVKTRPAINDPEPTPEQQDAIEQAISALNDAVEETQYVIEAAEGFANEAETSAVNAAASEYNASVSETNAHNSMTAAQTAQGLAEDARDDAISAKTQALSARTQAQTAKGKAEDAQTAAETAQGLAETAQRLAESAQTGAESAKTAADADALKAEGYAKGYQNGEPVESGTYYHDNALYFKQQASDSATSAAESASAASGSASDALGYKNAASGFADNASGSATSAGTNALKAEGFAVGKQNGTAVASGSPYYQNNAEYYAGQAADSATSAATSAATFETDTTLSVSGKAADAKKTGDEITDLKSHLTEVYDSVFAETEKGELSWVTGVVSNGSGTRTATGDKTCQPIMLYKGETVNVKTKGDGSYLFNVIASVASVDLVVTTDASVPCTKIASITTNALTTYSYTATNDIAIIISVYNDGSAEVTFENLKRTDRVTTLWDETSTLLDVPYYSNILNTLNFNGDYAGKYSPGIVGQQITFGNNGNFNLARISVTNGEKYSIGWEYTAGSRAWILTDANGIVTRRENGSVNGQRGIDIFTIGSGESYLYIQSYGLQFIRKYTEDIINDSKQASSLSGKKMIFEGDSIAESRLFGNSANGGSYAKLVCDLVNATFINYGVSGGILASAVPTGNMPHSVVSNIVNMSSDADLICFEGGVNDYWRNVPLGSYTENDYTGTLDTTTICGALESIFRQATEKWVGKPICFVITHKITNTVYVQNTAGYTWMDVHEKIVGICNKYAIPYYDAFSESGLNAYNSVQNTNYLTANSSGTPDGCHPNEAGYKRFYVPQLIALFNKIMPKNL